MKTSELSHRLFQALNTTWPAAEYFEHGPWMLRRGLGGGKRVSAASTDSDVSANDIAEAETQMRAMGQDPIFVIHDGNEALDRALADQGYRIVDPVLMLAPDCAELASTVPPPLAAIPGDEPLAIMREIWAEGGIGPARLAVMARVTTPKTYLFSRHDIDKPGGCAFVAMEGDIAMLHALEIVPAARRKGVGRALLQRAANWGLEQGATTFSVVTTGENLPAQGLFTGLGLRVVDKYHYRMK
jgi:GNAT superfamily N-acetyltransferase